MKHCSAHCSKIKNIHTATLPLIEDLRDYTLMILISMQINLDNSPDMFFFCCEINIANITIFNQEERPDLKLRVSSK